MHRFYITQGQIVGSEIRFTPSQARQMSRVLRMEIGERVLTFNGSGQEWEVEIVRISPRQAVGLILARRSVAQESPLQITLLQGLLKGSRMDYLIQKAAELGVAEIILLHLHRTVAEGLGKLHRWRRIAIEASEQSGRLTIPAVTGPYPLKAYLAGEEAGCSLLLWERERGRTLSEFLDREPPSPRVRILIGPEGGLDDDEVHLFTRAGFIPLSLGPRTLRAETAAIAAVTILQHRWGDLR